MPQICFGGVNSVCGAIAIFDSRPTGQPAGLLKSARAKAGGKAVSMKIGIFSVQYLPTMGGVERYTYEVARRAVRAGHAVCVITSALEGLPQKEVTAEGIVIYRLPVWPLMKKRFPIPKRNAAFRKLAKAIWAERFDACIVQARFYVGSLYALRQTDRRGIPTILIDHSSGHLLPAGRLAATIGHWYEHGAARFVNRHCSHIYGVSQTSCRWLEHLGFQTEGAFCNSVDMGQIERALQSNQHRSWRSTLGLTEEGRLVLFSGRLFPEKGILLLLQAILLMNRADVHLLIAGDGPLLQQIRDRASRQIHPLGSLEHDEMLSLFSQSDVYCLPSMSEGFATTLLEAAACQCPIVMTNTGGANELIASDQYGVILPDTKPEHIAAALDRVLSDSAWRKQAGLLLKRRVEEQFDWDVTAGRILARLEELAGKKP